MAVVASKRTISDMEFYNTALEIQGKVTNLLLRDFGIKEKIRNLAVMQGVRNVSDEDMSVLQGIANKYNMKNPLVDKYPSWLIEYLRSRILQKLTALMGNIRMGNSIYVTSLNEYHQRRYFQNLAIGNCYQLLDDFCMVLNVLPCNVSKYMPYVKSIEKEIFLLKGWRKNGNKVLKALSKGRGKNKLLNKLTDNFQQELRQG